ncbi:MAG: ABC transporter substrate-binding protein [Alphaproteobacteria bacterium]
MKLSTLLGGAAVAIALAMTPAYAKNTLRWASQGDALTLDPHAQNEGPTNAMNLNIMEPLVRSDKDLKNEPALATSWTVLEPTVWEFKLREGVKFHDGADFTADDVIFSIGRAQSGNSDFKNQIGSIAEVKKIDDHTVHLVTSGPNPILPNQLVTIAMMSKAWAEKHSVTEVQDFKNKQETYAIRNANGTGPFKVQLREPDVRTILVKNEDWWGAKDHGNVDEIIYTPISNAATRVAALLSGELDFVLDPPLQDIERIKRGAGLKVLKTPQNRSIFLGLDIGAEELRTSNVKGKNPFADVRVRQAMYQAIDIEAIRQKVMRGDSEPAGMIAAPFVSGWTEELDARLPYDVEASRKLLAEAGYPEGFQTKLDCPNDRYINDEGICQAVVGMLGRVGIKVALDAQSKSLHFPKIQKRTSDFYLLGWGVPTLDSHYVFSFLMHSKGTWNATGYANPRVDELTQAMETEVDVEKRNAMIAEVWKIARDEIVYLPLHHQVITWAMKDRLEMPIIANDSPQFRYAVLK